MVRRPILLTIAALGVVACATDDGRQLAPPEFAAPATTSPASTLPAEPAATTSPVVPATFSLIASWQNGTAIPTRHTCDGDNLSPALTWTNVPAGTVELAVTVVDLDAVGFVHWVQTGIDPQVSSLVENEQPLPGTAWTNSAGTIGYFGPCPPPADDDHVYQFTVHALDQRLELADDVSAIDVISTLNRIAIGQASVTGTFARTG